MAEQAANGAEPSLDAGAAGVAEYARRTEERMQAAEAARSRPPPLPEWAAPWADLIASQLRPIIRAEIRAELRRAAKS